MSDDHDYRARPLGREQAGLPEHAVIVQVLYNRSAKVTVVEVRLQRSSPIHRLYWRPVGDTVYRLLETQSPDQSFDQAVMCAETFLFTRVSRWLPSSEGRRGTVLGLLRVQLEGTPTISDVDLSIILPSGAWISKILRANDAGTELEAVVAFREGGPIRYAVCVLDLLGKRAVELDNLRGVFF
jgi:hypothetical protein